MDLNIDLATGVQAEAPPDNIDSAAPEVIGVDSIVGGANSNVAVLSAEPRATTTLELIVFELTKDTVPVDKAAEVVEKLGLQQSLLVLK